MSTDAGVRYAGFWIRLVATILDSILLLLIMVPLLLWIYGAAYFDPEAGSGPRGPMDILISYVFPAVAAIAFWKYRSATPGKMAVSARIVDACTGGKPSTTQCLVRYFAYLVSLFPFCLGFLWIAFDPRKQAWHDKLAGTVVVRGS